MAIAETEVTGEQRMHDVLAALGFQPQREPAAVDRLTYVLCQVAV